MTPERELIRLLASTAEQRTAAAGRAAALAAASDPARLEAELRRHRLLALAGTRLEALGALPAGLAKTVAAERRRNRLRSVVLDELAARAAAALDGAGIEWVALKGPRLARALYGDAGLRPSSDVDVLVAPADLDPAVAALRAAGWGEPDDPRSAGGLPLLHCSVPAADRRLPAVEIHWRLHWYEAASTATFLATASGHALGPDHEIAALLLFWARDGLLGLRYGADVAAWWDAHGAALERPPLDPLIAAHPELRTPLAAAALQAERLAGVPAARLLTGRAGRRSRLAARAANWTMEGDDRALAADLVLVDGLLSPPGGVRDFALRHLAPPQQHVARTYGLEPGPRLIARRWLHARAVTTHHVLGWARRARALPPAPPPPARPAILLAVHSTARGGAERMAVAEAAHLSARYAPVIAAPDGPLRAELGAWGELIEGTPMLPLWGASPLRWALALARTLRDVPRLHRLIRERRAALVLTNTATTLAPVLAARLARVPAVVHARDVPGSRLARTVLRAHGALADVVIAISPGVEAEFAGARRARVVRIADGVPIEAAGPPRDRSPDGPLRVAVVGALDVRKGQDVAVEALALLVRDGIDAELELVGREADAAFGAALRRRAAELGVAGRVRLPGEVDGVAARLAAADVVLAPSRAEWTPLSLMEALVHGRPVVASAVGDVGSIVVDGRTGLLVPAGDVAAVARAVRRIAEDPRGAAGMAARGRDHVQEHFAIDRSLDALGAQLEEALA